MNGLVQIRKDLSEIISLKKIVDLENRFNNGNSNFYKGNKDDIINKGCEEIKNVICQLAEKYKTEGENR